MTSAVLLLNADNTPLHIFTGREAMKKIVRFLLHVDDNGRPSPKADVVEDYEGRFLRSNGNSLRGTNGITLGSPAVMKLRNYVYLERPRIKFNRANVLARDAYQCSYCGARPVLKNGKPNLDRLTYDHVVPRAQAQDSKVILPWSQRKVMVTSWENILTACEICNHAKDDRVPDANGFVAATRSRDAMQITRLPKKPNVFEVMLIGLRKTTIPDEWKDHLAAGSAAWRLYWDVELDPT